MIHKFTIFNKIKPFLGGLDNVVKLWDISKVMEDLEAEGISGLGR